MTEIKIIDVEIQREERELKMVITCKLDGVSVVLTAHYNKSAVVADRYQRHGGGWSFDAAMKTLMREKGWDSYPQEFVDLLREIAQKNANVCSEQFVPNQETLYRAVRNKNVMFMVPVEAPVSGVPTSPRYRCVDQERSVYEEVDFSAAMP